MNKKSILDPRLAAYIVILFGAGAMFMNQAITAHIFCAVAAFYLIAVKSFKTSFISLGIYGIIALLMSNVSKIHNTSAMLLVVSLSYFVQKLIVLFMMGSFFTHVTSIPYVVSAMQKIKAPDALAVPLMVALRFFPTIHDDFKSLKDSLKLRHISIRPLSFIIHPVRMMEYLFVPILMKSLRTSDELSASAMLRGFEHIKEQTLMYPLKMKLKDYFVGIMSTLIVAALFYLQFKK